MKKWLTMVLLLALLLTGCGGTSSGENENGSSDQSAAGHTGGDLAAQAQKDPWGLVLAAEAVTDTGLTLRFVQSGGEPSGELQTGSPYWLEREENGEWTAVEPLMEDVAWDMMAYLISMDGETEMAVDWTALYGQLPAGSYRLGKSVMDFRDTGDYDYYACFVVAEGVPLSGSLSALARH